MFTKIGQQATLRELLANLTETDGENQDQVTCKI